MTLAEAELPQSAEASFTLANARLVLEDRVISGHLTVADGHIAEIAEGAAVPAGAIDCARDHILPGLIELHTDNLERHIQPRPKVEWPHNAAILAHDGELAACGITTVFDAMRVGSNISQDGTDYAKYARPLASELLDLKAVDALKISHFLHLRAEVCSETLVDELAEFGPDDRVGIVSLMDHTPGQRQFRDVEKLRAYVCGKNGLAHDEFEAHVAMRKALRDRIGDLHEAETVRAAARFGAVLASHDDTTAKHVAVSAGHGIHLAEFPTTIEAAEACRAHDIAIMMGAPNIIRGGSHSGNVSALDLAREGLLDIISSDYVPSALLLAAFRLAEIWSDLPRAIRTVTDAPAQAVGLTDRGRLAEGRRADLLRIRHFGETPIVRGCWSRGRRVG